MLEFTSAEPKITKSSATAVSSREGGGNQLSPFPLVDAHITSTLTRGGAQGNIRRWTYFSQGMYLVQGCDQKCLVVDICNPQSINTQSWPFFNLTYGKLAKSLRGGFLC